MYFRLQHTLICRWSARVRVFNLPIIIAVADREAKTAFRSEKTGENERKTRSMDLNKSEVIFHTLKWKIPYFAFFVSERGRGRKMNAVTSVEFRKTKYGERRRAESIKCLVMYAARVNWAHAIERWWKIRNIIKLIHISCRFTYSFPLRLRFFFAAIGNFLATVFNTQRSTSMKKLELRSCIMSLFHFQLDVSIEWLRLSARRSLRSAVPRTHSTEKTAYGSKWRSVIELNKFSSSGCALSWSLYFVVIVNAAVAFLYGNTRVESSNAWKI